MYALTSSFDFGILSSIAEVIVSAAPIPPFGGTEAPSASLTSVILFIS